MTNPSDILVDFDEAAPPAKVPNGAPLVDIDGTPIVDETADISSGLPKRAVKQANGTVRLPLLYPVTLGIRNERGEVRTETYSELTFRRQTGADIRAIQATAKESQPAMMLARSTSVAPAVMNILFDKMDGADINAAIAVVESFFSNGRTTGQSS